MSPLVRKAIAFSLVLASLFALFAGMALNNEGGASTGESILPRFKSTNELVNHLEASSNSAPTYNEGNGFGLDDGDNSHSKTNIQVEGVDEMDMVKTDGSLLCIANYQGISIINAYPADTLSNHSFIPSSGLIQLSGEEFTVIPQGIFLHGDRLVVISMFYIWESFNGSDDAMFGFNPGDEMTTISLIDITDPSTPHLEKSCGISGFIVGARMVDGVVYGISQNWIFSVNNFNLPMVMNGNEIRGLDGSDIHYDPQCDSQCGYINIIAMDIGSSEFETLSVLADWTSTIYMTHGSIYLAMRDWQPTPLGFEDTLKEVSSRVKTSIFSIEISGTSMQPVAKGEVPGWLLNQFSMDEYEGNLRVVTTTSWEPAENCVFVLDQSLNITGSLAGIAPSETVQAARFYGDILYLVTFLRVDPLFVIDLRDASNPVALGELEVPGFSAYLHRIDQDHVLGVGMENSSVKITIYDVSDPFAPEEVSKYLVEGEYSYSEALWDHHAILIDVQRGLLVIPLRCLNSSSEMWVHGTAVFNITGNEVTLRGIIDLGEWNRNLRSVYIENMLYSISPTTILVNDISDLSEVNLLVYQSQLGNWRTYPTVGNLGE